jgi:hypothetical protein
MGKSGDRRRPTGERCTIFRKVSDMRGSIGGEGGDVSLFSSAAMIISSNRSFIGGWIVLVYLTSPVHGTIQSLWKMSRWSRTSQQPRMYIQQTYNVLIAT